MNNTKKMVFVALLVALALAISLVESMIPVPFVAPGAKLGLSNIVILVTLVVFGLKEGFTVATMKSFLLMLITGSVSSFFYSFAGAVLSTLAMYVAYYKFGNYFSLIGVSIIGAVAHNLGQILVASFVLGTVMIFTYLPVLIFTGLATGYFVGLSAWFVSKSLNRSKLFR